MDKRGDIVLESLKQHPSISQKLTLRQKAADILAEWVGSWTFILIFIVFLAIWIILNSYILLQYYLGEPWDSYPYVFLNLVLACITSFQAPIILMSQNREAQKDRIRAEYDYAVNRKAEKEIKELQSQLDRIEKKLSKR